MNESFLDGQGVEIEAKQVLSKIIVAVAESSRTAAEERKNCSIIVRLRKSPASPLPLPPSAGRGMAQKKHRPSGRVMTCHHVKYFAVYIMCQFVRPFTRPIGKRCRKMCMAQPRCHERPRSSRSQHSTPGDAMENVFPSSFGRRGIPHRLLWGRRFPDANNICTVS